LDTEILKRSEVTTMNRREFIETSLAASTALALPFTETALESLWW
jgi:hypothetical protein